MGGLARYPKIDKGSLRRENISAVFIQDPDYLESSAGCGLCLL